MADKFMNRRVIRNPSLTRKEANDIVFQQKEIEVKDWLERVLERTLPEDLHEALGDGIVLCSIVNKMFPAQNLIGQISPPDSLPFQLRDNVTKFLDVMKKLKMHPGRLFQVEDLFSKKNMRLVYNTIETLASMAAEKGFPVTWLKYSDVLTAEAHNYPMYDGMVAGKNAPAAPVRPKPKPQPVPVVPVPEPPKEEPQVLDFWEEVLARAAKDKSVLNTLHEGRTPLHDAVAQSNADAVEKLVAAGADPNVRTGDDAGDTALHLAVVREDMRVTDCLIDKGKADLEARNKHGCAPIHSAITDGYDAATLRLIERGADVTARTPAGDTPMHLACREANLVVVRALAAKAAAKLLDAENEQKELPLHVAAQYGNADMVGVVGNKGIVNRQRADGCTPLHAAVMRGDPDVVEALLRMGADPTIKNAAGNTPIILAAEVDNIRLLEIMADRAGAAAVSGGKSALYTAAWNGNVPAVELLCKRGAKADIKNDQGWTAMHAAALRGHLAVLETLVKNGAHVDDKSDDGSTPFFHACEKGHVKCVQYLLTKGASSASLQDGWSPLQISVHHKQRAVLKALLEKGVDVNAKNSSAKGYTALHMAVAMKHPDAELIADLLNARADVNVQSDSGQTPLHLAAFWGHADIARTLVANGADLSAKNKKDRTPAQLASYYGHEDLAKELAGKQGVPAPEPRKRGVGEKKIRAMRPPQEPPTPDRYMKA